MGKMRWYGWAFFVVFGVYGAQGVEDEYAAVAQLELYTKRLDTILSDLNEREEAAVEDLSLEVFVAYKKELEDIRKSSFYKESKNEALQTKFKEVFAKVGKRLGQPPSKKAETLVKKSRGKVASLVPETPVLASLPARLLHQRFLSQIYPPASMATGKELSYCVKGILADFPVEISPARGKIVCANNSLKKMVKQAKEVDKKKEKLSFIQELFLQLFTISPEDRLISTGLASNPVIACSPEMIAQCIRMIYADQVMTVGMSSEFLTEWRKAYEEVALEGKQFSVFSKRTKEFLKNLHESSKTDRQTVFDALLAFLVLRIPEGHEGEVLQRFADALGISFRPLLWHENEFEYVLKKYQVHLYGPEEIERCLEELLFLIERENKGDLLPLVYFPSARSATVEGRNFSACQEKCLTDFGFYDSM